MFNYLYSGAIMTKLSSIIVILFVFACLTGCNTVSSMKYTQGQGFRKTYEFSYEQVWSVVPKAVKKTGGSISESNKSEGRYIVSFGPSLRSWGQNLAIFIKKTASDKAKVEVVSKDVALLNDPWTIDRSQEMLNAIEDSLA